VLDELRGRPARRERVARGTSRAAATVARPAGRPLAWAGRKLFGLVKGIAKAGLIAGAIGLVLLILDALLVRDVDRP
jgi:hypothetical protein